MDGNNELKGIKVKNRACYYFDDIINISDLGLAILLLDEKHTKIF